MTGFDLPTGSTVEIMRGPVDYSGAMDPGKPLVTTLTASDVLAGAGVVPIDTSASCFVYATVVSSTGRRVAFTNPIFLLREQPLAARAVPAWRVALDSVV